MLSRDNYTNKHITAIRAQTKADPSIIERTVFAFGLLEAITKVGMPFIFKGGTSLLVMLDDPRRLSTDIDIIVEPGTDIEGFIRKAGVLFPFTSVEENKRTGINKIEKRHFRFHFNSPRTEEEITVLLDVVFEENPYYKVSEREIKSSLLLTEGENLKVRIPDKNCILGDKLTAFAPHTTGIPFGINKELEIIKQLFDCWTLLQEMDDFKTVSRVYNRISRLEIGYRGLEKEPSDCLRDTIQSCICILGRGSIRSEEYKLFSDGIGAIQNHIFKGRINGENAGIYVSEVMYLAACILAGEESYIRIDNPEAFRNPGLKIQGIKKVSSMRNINPKAYAYMVRSLQMLQEIGLYTKSVNALLICHQIDLI